MTSGFYVSVLCWLMWETWALFSFVYSDFHVSWPITALSQFLMNEWLDNQSISSLDKRAGMSLGEDCSSSVLDNKEVMWPSNNPSIWQNYKQYTFLWIIYFLNKNMASLTDKHTILCPSRVTFSLRLAIFSCLQEGTSLESHSLFWSLHVVYWQQRPEHSGGGC